MNTRIARVAATAPTRGKARPTWAPACSLLQDVLARGMAPEVVADQVLAAYRAERFWILTHDDEAETWVEAVNRRAQSLIDRTDPAFGVPL